MIETSHEISENFGLERAAEMLCEDHPEIKVSFYENNLPWRVL